MFFCVIDREGRKAFRLLKIGSPAAGFTLAEILVAISIFALVVSILFGSLTFLLSRTEMVREGVMVYEEARICLDRISTDLQAVYVSGRPGYEPPDIDDDPDPYRFLCEASQAEDTRLEFTAFSHLPLGGGVPAMAGKIIYYLQETENDGLVLMRRDVALKTDDSAEKFSDKGEQGTDPILCRHIGSFNIICFDEDGTEYESWDSDSSDFSYATPSLIQVGIEIKGLHAGYRFETTIAPQVFREKAANAL